jgi:coenzyme F420 hydrogenase subunit beta
MVASVSPVAEICSDEMCTGCGTCAGICPSPGTLRMRLIDKKGTYEPVFNGDTCMECGLCRDVCPPLTWARVDERRTFDGQPEDAQLGPYHSCFAGFAEDAVLRYHAASGGLVTALLLHLLESKEITGAFVVRRRRDDPLFCDVVLASTREDILASRGSKYSPVSFDGMYQRIKELDPSRNRVAVVGLPCHIEGLYRTIQHQSRLREVVRFMISLVCGGTPSFSAYDYLLRRIGILRAELRRLSNRGGGWPGFMSMETRDGRVIRVPYRHHLSMGMVLSSPVFKPTSCLLCPDPVGFSADIVFSDGWLERFAGDRLGVSLALVRHPYLVKVMRRMREGGKASLEECPGTDFIRANRTVVHHKIFDQPLGLRIVLGENGAKYLPSKRPAHDRNPLRLIKRLAYFAHIRLLARGAGTRQTSQMGRVPLFYFKMVNLLKR